MEMTARLTGDAVVSSLKNDQQVVKFSVAINDSYRVRGKNEPVKTVTYVQCDYWVNPGIAPYLTKGKLIEMQGRIGISAYMGKDGEPKAALTFHVNFIKLHGTTTGATATHLHAVPGTMEIPAEDLPF